MARAGRTLARVGSCTELLATPKKAFPAVNARRANDNAAASAGLIQKNRELKTSARSLRVTHAGRCRRNVYRRHDRGQRLGDDVWREAASCSAGVTLEAKKYQAIPFGAGDLAGDRGQRLIWPAQIFKIVRAHRDAVLDPLVFPDQSCTGDRPLEGARFPFSRVPGRVLFRHGAEPLQ